MGYFRPERLPDDAETRQARRDAHALLDASAGHLREGRTLPLACAEGLSSLLGDERLRDRTRRRAAQILLTAQGTALVRLVGRRSRA